MSEVATLSITVSLAFEDGWMDDKDISPGANCLGRK